MHVIPPFDGIYVKWDYRAGKVATYYNPWQPRVRRSTARTTRSSATRTGCA